MTVTTPETQGAYGLQSAVMIQTLADTSAPKLATEVQATTSLNVSCFLYGDAVAGTTTTNRGQAPKKLCTRQQFERRGTKTFAVADITYSHLPQAALTDPSNKAKATLTEGTLWWMMVRSGKPGESAFAVGDRVDLWRVELLDQNRGTAGEGEFSEFAIVQGLLVKTPGVIYESVLTT